MDEQQHEDTLHTKQAKMFRVISQSLVIRSVTKTVRHVEKLQSKCSSHEKKYAREAQLHMQDIVGIHAVTTL